MDKYSTLYSGLENVKSSDGVQHTALCPFHEDRNNSLSYRTDTGVFNCFAGCGSGGAYDYAVMMGVPNPEQYYANSKQYSNNGIHLAKTEEKPLITEFNGENMAEAYTYLQNHLELIPSYWLKEIVKEWGVGYKDSWYYPYVDDGKLVGYKFHKKEQVPKGNIKCRVFPSKEIVGTYDTKNPLCIFAGEGDSITGASFGAQAITFTCGESSIPRCKDGSYDLLWLSKWTEIVICYDNDDTGRDGAVKLKDAVLKILKKGEVHIIKWDKNLAKGYDVSDAYKDDKHGKAFHQAVKNADIYKTKRKGMEVLSYSEFMNKKYPPNTPIVENFLYKNHISIIGGDTGCMKSWLAKQLALSIATGVPFLDFYETTPSRVMLIQFENENADMQKRFKMMEQYFDKHTKNPNWADNFRYAPKDSQGLMFMDKWKIIEETLAEHDWTDASVIVDNLYSSTELEIQNNHQCTHLLRAIDGVRSRFRNAICCFAHTNKIDSQTKKLRKEDLQGGQTLVNCVSFVTMMGKSSTSDDIKLLKIVKGRSDYLDGLEDKAFKIHWKNGIFRKGAIVKNEALHFEAHNDTWEMEILKYLREQDVIVHRTFSRQDLKDNLPEKYENMEDYKITRFINKVINFGFIERVSPHNEYRLNVQEIDDWD